MQSPVRGGLFSGGNPVIRTAFGLGFGAAAWQWACSSAGEHYVDIVGVTGSIPVTPTIAKPLKSQEKKMTRRRVVAYSRRPSGPSRKEKKTEPLDEENEPSERGQEEAAEMPRTAKPNIRIGIGGWVYEPWRGVFYPDGLARKRELEYAGTKLTSIEINGTDLRFADAGELRAVAGRNARRFLIFSQGTPFRDQPAGALRSRLVDREVPDRRRRWR